MKHSILFAGTVLAAGLIFAQAEPGTVEQMATETSSTITEGAKAKDQLWQFLSAKGWTEGENYKADGSVFIVTTGVGTIAALPNHPNYINSRTAAFEKAMLAAKVSLANYLEQTISTAVETSYEEGASAQADDAETTEDVAAETPAEDADTAAEGDGAKAAAAMEQVPEDTVVGETYAQLKQVRAQVPVSSETYKRAVASASKALVSGLQAFYTVEAQPAGKNGEIGVVAIWSPALAETAACMVTGRVPPVSHSAKAPIAKQVPTDAKNLISTFGVQQKIDQNGNLVLVAYGQAAAASSSARAANAAHSKARLNASAMIRAFAGEAIEGASSLTEAETAMDYGEGNLPDYTSENAYQEYQKSVGKALAINGIATVREWSYRHPTSGKEVYGTIVSWSPKGAQFARQAKVTIEETAKDGAEGRRSVPEARPLSTSREELPEADRFYNGGNAGDDDAF